MTTLKIIQGVAYAALLKQLDVPINTTPLSKEMDGAYDVIDKDLPRTRYMVLSDTIEHFKERFKCEIQAQEEFSYLQGDLTAANFATLPLNIRIYLPYVMENTDNPTLKQHDLSFAYLDDENNLCGFSISYLFSQDAHEITDYTIAQVKNTASPLDMRNITLMYNVQDETLSQDFAGQPLTGDFKTRLKTIIGSEKIFTLLSPLFDKNGNIQRNALNALENRLIINGNLDNRDHLKPVFETYLQLARQNGCQDKETLLAIEDALRNDPNYFMPERLIERTKKLLKLIGPIAENNQPLKEALIETHKKLIPLLDAFKEKMDNDIKKSEKKSVLSSRPPILSLPPEPFFNRHRASLLRGLIFAGFTIGLGLILTGVLAPLGLMVTSMTSLAGGMVLAGMGISVTGFIMNLIKLKKDEANYQQQDVAIASPLAVKNVGSSKNILITSEYQSLIQELTSITQSPTPDNSTEEETSSEDERPPGLSHH